MRLARMVPWGVWTSHLPSAVGTLTYSVPGGPSRQVGFLQQHHILHATFGQVIGHADPHASPADDDRVGGVLPPLSES
ncbi:hypothetical protein EYF80_052397 [Liparis tanakae]|uniref:Uncharacterized protein n=1 Tax=Liparis tanakae TaxID=230148 RepID=A0A4Z2F9G4_9TELE|nr:hypothetical protein EYF80_052397 [Liparis tanakae]